jgi:hypothetical protein
MSVAEKKRDLEKGQPLTLLRPGSLSLTLGSSSLGGSFLRHSEGVERGGGFREGGRGFFEGRNEELEYEREPILNQNNALLSLNIGVEAGHVFEL